MMRNGAETAVSAMQTSEAERITVMQCPTEKRDLSDVQKVVPFVWNPNISGMYENVNNCHVLASISTYLRCHLSRYTARAPRDTMRLVAAPHQIIGVPIK